MLLQKDFFFFEANFLDAQKGGCQWCVVCAQQKKVLLAKSWGAMAPPEPSQELPP